VAQKRVPAVTGEAQRAQAGPEPGAVSRRPQCGQKGSWELIGEPQKGQAEAAVLGLDAGGSATPTAAARAAADFVSGLPQSVQNCAPASFWRPQ
jgi:hypothetical protein